MLQPSQSYDDLISGFRWQIPERYNIGVDVCDKWARREPDRPALIHLSSGGAVRRYGFGDLMRLSNKLANALTAAGLVRGDRLAILLPQAPETAIAHIAAYKLGAIAVPLFTLFGAEALEYRLLNSGAKIVMTDADGHAKLAEIRPRLPDLARVITIEAADGSDDNLPDLLDRASDRFTPIDTAADDPALIIYTSGTTGPPKGALHGHRVLLGHLPGVEMPHDFFPQPDDLFWTPADWAWIGGLLDVLLPSLHHGVPVLVHRFAKFDPEEAFRLLAEFKVRNVFMPPTALKMMRQVPEPRRWKHALRSLGSGGESLGAELVAWGEEAFGVTMNEFYGQTECNLVVSGCAAMMPARTGAIGRAVPGHRVAIIDETGNEMPDGTPGTIAVHRPDPVMFLEYWRNPDASAEKFVGDWLLTGDRGCRDSDGYISFIGRDDDIISSGGYRIGPGEIEECLLKHPAVAMAAAVGVPDTMRGERVKAFIVLAEGQAADTALAKSIKDFVKTRLAAHEYPREVAFVDALPMTTTGKIMRRELRNLSTP